MQKDADQLAPGDRIVVTIKRIGINGEGVGYYKRKTVFIPGALPDEVVKAKVTKAESGFIQAELVEVEKKSPHRIAPICPVYEQCGGCQLQHMAYEGQLQAKQQLVEEAFRRYAEGYPVVMRPIIGMNDPWSYRTKAQLQTASHNGDLSLGLYSPGSHRLVDITGCPIQHPKVNEIAGAVKKMLAQLKIRPYDDRKKSGDLRTVVIRTGSAESGGVQLTFVTHTDKLPSQDRLVELVRRQLPEVVTIAHNVNPRQTPLVFGEKTRILWGRETIEEQLKDLRFSLSPRAFFQLNPAQTVHLYECVKEAAALTGNEQVVDAYCGTGTIALWLAAGAKEIRGIETIAEAVEDARSNARNNGIDNAQFFTGKSEELLAAWHKRGYRPDVVVVDPPRSGCGRELLQTVLDIKPKRFVYVSCNPSTLAKDCSMLLNGGYRIEWAQPVDMFPQTAHVECSVLLKWAGV